MKRLIAALKKVRISQFLMTFLVGVLLFVSTACSGGKVQASTGDRTDVPAGMQNPQVKSNAGTNPRPEVPGGTMLSPNRGDAINKYQPDSMNEFSDVDPRTPNTQEGKAKSLVKNAERNLENRADTPEKYVRNYQQGTPLGERVKRLGEDVSNSTEEVTTGVSKGTQRGVENIKGNTKDAAKDVSNSASKAAENVKENTKSAGKDVVNKTQNATEDTSNFVQGKVNEAVKTTQRNLDKAGNAIKDAVD